MVYIKSIDYDSLPEDKLKLEEKLAKAEVVVKALSHEMALVRLISLINSYQVDTENCKLFIRTTDESKA